MAFQSNAKIPRRGAVGGTVCLAATVLLVVGWNVQPASSIFEKAKCEGGTNGTKHDEPCVVDAYLGSTVTIVCPDEYDEVEPATFAEDNTKTKGCLEKMPAAPGKCPKNKEVFYKNLKIGHVEVKKPTFTVPFTKPTTFKNVTTVYARCAKSDNSKAMYFGIRYIPRPKFPDSGAIVSCPALVDAEGKTCDLATRLGDVAVFDCPPDTSLTIVPAQDKDKATICKKALKKKDDTCESDDKMDISGKGVTAMFQKKGKEVRAVAFKNPATGGGSDLTGYLMCKGESKVAFFKYSISFEMSNVPPLPDKHSVCDPADGTSFLDPCEINLKPREVVVLNCAGLMNYIPKKLTDPKNGVFCTKRIGGGDDGSCAEDNEMKWNDVGAKIFSSANNLIVAFVNSTKVKKPTEAHGRCSQGDVELHFKITFQSVTTTTTQAGGGAAYTNNQSITTAACLGVLGAILLLAGAP